MLAVVDTNVLVSALLGQGRGKPIAAFMDSLTNEALGHGIQPAFDHRILAEYAEVLTRPRFRTRFVEGEAVALYERIQRVGLDTGAVPQYVGTLPDESDRPFVEVALATGAPLITGNAKHFPPDLGIELMKPADALEWLTNQSLRDR